MIQLIRTILFVSLVALGPGCADDLREMDDEPMAMADGGTQVNPYSETLDNGDGSYTTTINATRTDTWIYFDFESESEVTDTDSTWDMGFQRFHGMLNGGVSGQGDAALSVHDDRGFPQIAAVPEAEFISDVADGPEDEDDIVDYAFSVQNEGWYDYNPATHVLTPKERVYVVRSSEGNHYKLRVLDYYDDAGTSAHLKFQWAPLVGDEEPLGFLVDASASDSVVYLKVGEAGPVVISEPNSSMAWDLGIQRTQFVTNSGTSGIGFGGALVSDGAYPDVHGADTLGFSKDELLPLPGPPGSGEFSGNPILNSWYDYNPTTHEVSSKGEVYLIRRASGSYAKLKIDSYEDGVYRLQLEEILRSPKAHPVTLNASDGESWTYFNLRTGQTTVPAAPTDAGDWDIAFSRTRAKTNGGTSGTGMGAALDTTESDLASVLIAPAAGYAQDEMVPVPGPPGSGEYSGNPSLGAWFDYDFMTHVVSPKATSFVVQTVDGSFAKLQVTTYSDGIFGLTWMYAGPNYNNFAGN